MWNLVARFLSDVQIQHGGHHTGLPCYQCVSFFVSLVDNGNNREGTEPELLGVEFPARVMFDSTRLQAGLLPDCSLQSD